MEQVRSIPFSRVLASLLLEKKKASAIDVVNYASKVSCGYGDFICDIEDDDLDFLSLCVESDEKMNFRLKDYMDYDTVLYDDVTVRKFLSMNSLDYYDTDMLKDKAVPLDKNIKFGNKFEKFCFKKRTRKFKRKVLGLGKVL